MPGLINIFKFNAKVIIGYPHFLLVNCCDVARSEMDPYSVYKVNNTALAALVQVVPIELFAELMQSLCSYRDFDLPFSWCVASDSQILPVYFLSNLEQSSCSLLHTFILFL
jgi:hypothetical protein